MTDKVLCPWCGAEMKPKGLVLYETRNDEHPRYIGECWCSGEGCEAAGPCVQGKDKKGFATREEAKEAARAAALRRYTPSLKPMTLKEIKAAKVVWIEDPEVEYEKELYPAIYWGVGNVEWAVFIADIDDGNEQGWYYMPDYGKLWRAWERKPTDEERSAVEWET